MTIHFNFWRTIRTEPRLKLRLTNEPRLNVLGSKCRWLATSFDVNAMLMLSLATNNAKHYTPLWGQKVSKILEIQATIRYVSFTFIHTYVWCVCVCAKETNDHSSVDNVKNWQCTGASSSIVWDEHENVPNQFNRLFLLRAARTNLVVCGNVAQKHIIYFNFLWFYRNVKKNLNKSFGIYRFILLLIFFSVFFSTWILFNFETPKWNVR